MFPDLMQNCFGVCDCRREGIVNILRGGAEMKEILLIGSTLGIFLLSYLMMGRVQGIIEKYLGKMP